MGNEAKIKGITKWFEVDKETVYKGLMIRYLNGDVSFDVVQSIDKKLNEFKKKVRKNKEYNGIYGDLTYWKYKFLISNKNQNRNVTLAYNFLKDAYKAGSVDAIAQYGYCYYLGKDIVTQADKRLAQNYFNKALKNKDKGTFVEYLFAEAMMQEVLEGKMPATVENLNVIIEYYELALNKKVFECLPNLARAYIMANRDLDKAEKYLKKARTSNQQYSSELEQIKKLKNNRR